MDKHSYRLDYVRHRIKEIRNEKKISQLELAKKSNGAIARTTIHGYEIGKISPTLSGLYTIADALDVSIYELLPVEKAENETKTNTPIASNYIE